MGSLTRYWVLAAMILVALSGCAAPVRPERMVPEAVSLPTFGPDSPWRNAITITKVAGGEETSAMGHSNVGDKELKAALQTALQQEGLLGQDESSAPLRLKAEFVSAPESPCRRRG